MIERGQAIHDGPGRTPRTSLPDPAVAADDGARGITDLRSALTELTEIDTVEALWQCHCRHMAQYGFDRLLYGFTRFRTETSLGDPADFVVLTNHAPAYRHGFVEGGLYKDAPMVRWALENDGWASWRIGGDMLAEGLLDDKARRVVEFNLTHRVTAGYTISFRAVSRRSKGAISMAARPGLSQDDADAIWARHGRDIVLLNNIVHLKIMTLPVSLPNQALTRRQREALEWVGDGKTMQDIAQIMGLTQATIEKHLRLARETLNVDTTAQAVAKAAFQNQMFVVEHTG